MTQSMFRFFIAGIIQGSHRNDDISSQSYREFIKALLEEAFPESTVYCPVENHPDSVNYTDDKARATFIRHVDIVKASDAIVVYVPEASMGSAIEMWEARHHRTLIITISPMRTKWVVRLFSDHIVNDLKEFEHFVRSGVLNNMLKEQSEKQGGKPQNES
jgi:hypothetical protein